MLAPKIPPYRRHANGQGYSSHKGQRFYFGRYDLPASVAEYERFVKRLLTGASEAREPASGSQDGAVMDLVADYLEWAESYYSANGRPSAEHGEMVRSLKVLADLYGGSLGRDAGPRWVTTLQAYFTKQKYSRNYVNKQVSRIKRFFRWCCSRELLPPELYHKLACVESLKKGRSQARETSPVEPVPIDHVIAVLPFLSPVVADMVQVQFLCGMRPQDICRLRPSSIEKLSGVWLCRPAEHKNAWRGQSLTKAIPVAAQAILAKYIDRHPDVYCFDPHEAESHRIAELRKKRKTPVQPSQQKRNRGRRTKQIRDHYDTTTYCRAVQRGIWKAKKSGASMPLWSPNQLRHSIATVIAGSLGDGAAQRWLGHSSPDTIAIYAAREVAELVTIAQALDERWSVSPPLQPRTSQAS